MGVRGAEGAGQRTAVARVCDASGHGRSRWRWKDGMGRSARARARGSSARFAAHTGCRRGPAVHKNSFSGVSAGAGRETASDTGPGFPRPGNCVNILSSSPAQDKRSWFSRGPVTGVPWTRGSPRAGCVTDVDDFVIWRDPAVRSTAGGGAGSVRAEQHVTIRGQLDERGRFRCPGRSPRARLRQGTAGAVAPPVSALVPRTLAAP